LPPDVRFLKLKCTQLDFGWGFAPDPAGGACAPPDPELDLRGRGNMGEREGRRMGREGKGRVGESRGKGKGQRAQREWEGQETTWDGTGREGKEG